MGFADLHIHSVHSYDGTSSVSAVLKQAADYADLDVIAITDHDTMAGVQEALDLAPAYGIEVIPGCEVSTADGHLLALFVDQPVPAGLSLVQTVRLIGEQGGLCIAAHPTAWGMTSLSFADTHLALFQRGVKNVLVGVEAFNGGLIYTRSNPLVEALSQALPLAQVGNSDSHVLKTIGQGATQFEGRTAADLRNALIHRKTKVVRSKGLDGLGILWNYIPQFLLRILGWVPFNAHPYAPLTYTRLAYARSYHTRIPGRKP
ncbi:MAG: PHP domain-containing protein [Anaerolineaceae bacterium]